MMPTVITDTPTDLVVDWLGQGLDNGQYDHTFNLPVLQNWLVNSAVFSYPAGQGGGALWSIFLDVQHSNGPDILDVDPGLPVEISIQDFNYSVPGSGNSQVGIIHPTSESPHWNFYTLSFDYFENPSGGLQKDLKIRLEGRHEASSKSVSKQLPYSNFIADSRSQPLQNGTDAAGNGQCAATATINSFVYLYNTFPSVYGGTKIITGTPTTNTLEQARDQLHDFMGSCGDVKAIWEGKLRWISTYAPGTTVFDGMLFYDFTGWVAVNI